MYICSLPSKMMNCFKDVYRIPASKFHGQIVLLVARLYIIIIALLIKSVHFFLAMGEGGENI